MEDRINERLARCDLPQITELTTRTLKRIKQIENYVIQQEEQLKTLIQEIKDCEITRVSISKKIGIARKTIYNNKLLKIYCEDIIENAPDSFNVGKIKELEDKFSEVSIKYDKLLINIIEINELKIEVKEYEKEISKIIEQNHQLKKIIYEKNQLIEKLNSKLGKKENLINFK